MTLPPTIDGFHAHVYYENDLEREKAAEIRTHVAENFDVVMGRWRDSPVGPHPIPMFQIAFSNPVFLTLVPWLMLNHGPLNILIHPNTTDAVADHRDYPLWLGTKLPLNIAFLEAGNTTA